MKKAILFGVPHHSNLGDHAIAIAEKRIITEKFPEYEYKEIAEENIHKCLEKVQSYVTDEDILFLHGGGNFGNQYPFIEEGRRKIIQTFPNNKIILFPETIYFTDDENGRKELELSKEIYSKHEKIYLMAREELSYKIMKKEFPTLPVYFTPDIVTILNESKKETNRDGIYFIIRSDVESKVEKSFIEEIEKVCKSKDIKVNYTDTAKGGFIYEHKKRDELEDMFDLYRNSELIFTDRLHGMIFAAITGTPCIALGNYNHKIEESAKWFKDFKYISYISGNESLEYIDKEVERLLNLKTEQYNNKYSTEIFDKVFNEIKEN